MEICFFSKKRLLFEKVRIYYLTIQGVVLEWLRERFAKPCRVGSIPTHASIFFPQNGFFETACGRVSYVKVYATIPGGNEARKNRREVRKIVPHPVLFARRSKTDAGAHNAGNQKDKSKIHSRRNRHPVRTLGHHAHDDAQKQTCNDGNEPAFYAPAFIFSDRFSAMRTTSRSTGNLLFANRTFYQLCHFFFLPD